MYNQPSKRNCQNDTVCTQPVFEPNTNDQPFLPFELIVEILLRLPARILLQFRCVCKLWKTLISDPNFANKHFLISTADPSLTHHRLAFSDRSYPLISLLENPSDGVTPDRFNLENNQDYLLGSCNGFLCFYDPDRNNIAIYNTLIRLKSNSSPQIKPSHDWGMPCNGFGYDHVNDKYKVLAVLEHDGGGINNDEDFGELLTKIYTFGDDSWRTIQDLPYTPPPPIQKCGKYVSGTLNWVACTWINPTPYVIISFDLDKETYRDVLLPQNVPGGDYMCRPSLCVLNDCLCLCFVNRTHLVVWSMKEYGVVESWTELMNIPRQKLSFLNPIHSYSIIELLFISENGVVLLMASSQLFLYNLNSGVLDHPLITFGNLYDPQIYRENLISPQ